MKFREEKNVSVLYRQHREYKNIQQAGEVEVS